MTSLEASTVLTAARVVALGRDMVIVRAGEGSELAWHFGRQRKGLAAGKEVWLARGSSGPVALAYCVDSGGPVTVLLSRPRRALLND